jgi:hypothetical protein
LSSEPSIPITPLSCASGKIKSEFEQGNLEDVSDTSLRRYFYCPFSIGN